MVSTPTSKQSKHLMVSLTFSEKLKRNGSVQQRLELLAFNVQALIQALSISGIPFPSVSQGLILTLTLSKPAAVGLSLYITNINCSLETTLPQASSNDHIIL